MEDHEGLNALTRETPQLVALLKEMKDGLDAVRSKVQALTLKVRENQLLTADGMSYLETKHLLLLSYCQSIVYYLLRKAKGLSIEGHPVVQTLVEIRLFLEKIRPIDKKLEYQVQKLTKAAGNVVKDSTISSTVKEKEGAQSGDDPSRFRPNPDMLVPKTSEADQAGGLYVPPRFAPTSMDDDKDKMSKVERQAKRRQKELLRISEQSPYWKELMDNIQDKPEELQESVGPESRELSRYLSKREEQERQEEELFIRAPTTKRDKKLEKHLMKSRNGLTGLTDGFDEVLKFLPQKENDDTDNIPSMNASRGKRFKKQKRKH
ncbi:uncharacterized protein A4U43_C06F6220 [Asparagus officinalis]|uniref:Sas10 C-terminal domain-containing protein n=1 Tax=Asparagus officinalis TaxID=4686 RepID=A0A5P1EJY1_ASPOF|nr:neuroguidin [Asparagus officinalis]ONK66295.1 uncharacterized protein A4U43_C06F6220 [Asparagus officinalis]